MKKWSIETGGKKSFQIFRNTLRVLPFFCIMLALVYSILPKFMLFFILLSGIVPLLLLFFPFRSRGEKIRDIGLTFLGILSIMVFMIRYLPFDSIYKSLYEGHRPKENVKYNGSLVMGADVTLDTDSYFPVVINLEDKGVRGDSVLGDIHYNPSNQRADVIVRSVSFLKDGRIMNEEASGSVSEDNQDGLSVDLIQTNRDTSFRDFITNSTGWMNEKEKSEFIKKARITNILEADIISQIRIKANKKIKVTLDKI